MSNKPRHPSPAARIAAIRPRYFSWGGMIVINADGFKTGARLSAMRETLAMGHFTPGDLFLDDSRPVRRIWRVTGVLPQRLVYVKDWNDATPPHSLICALRAAPSPRGLERV